MGSLIWHTRKTQGMINIIIIICPHFADDRQKKGLQEMKALHNLCKAQLAVIGTADQ